MFVVTKMSRGAVNAVSFEIQLLGSAKTISNSKML